ncbi:uncharacterized protein LOC134835336 [Culicoides brevitarsis]|uniref:uncharacterized protein LOC134835336 n=1 Tax=Culicoides brevitarsis TaxID=469753 RepID=UPI00307BAD00
MPTSEATTVQFNRTFVNYNDALSQSNPPSYNNSSSITVNGGHKPNNLSLNDSRLKKIYSVVGDTIGMAPLASPESLSEMSSVSSLQNGDYTPEEKHLLSDFESQMHTPKILRRAPKINAPLSNIDWKTIEEYQTLGQVFFTNPKKVPSNDDLNSSDIMIDDTFDYTNFNKHQFEMYRKHESSRSDNSLDETEQFANNSTKLGMSDSAIHNRKSNALAIEIGIVKGANTVSSSGTYASAVSSLSGLQNYSNGRLVTKMNVFEEEEYFMSRVTPEGVIESHFPVYHDFHEGPDYRFDSKNKASNFEINSNSCSTIGNESLPLLANLNERTVNVTNAANYVRRKKYVYPIGRSAAVHGSPSYRVSSSTVSPKFSRSSQSINKNESSV